MSRIRLELTNRSAPSGLQRWGDRLFDDEIRVVNRRLRVRDHKARAALDQLTDCIREHWNKRHSPEPVSGRTGAAHLCRFGAKARSRLAVARFGIRLDRCGGQARVTARLGDGAARDRPSARIARETARNQLKAVFAKTETHRQGELVALLSTLRAGYRG